MTITSEGHSQEMTEFRPSCIVIGCLLAFRIRPQLRHQHLSWAMLTLYNRV